MKPSELLSSPEKWTKGVYARDSKGYIVLASSSEAVCFCLVAAIYRCYTIKSKETLDRLEEYLDTRPTSWNDAPERTFEEVRAALIAIGE